LKVIVLGGGVIGVTSAYYLRRAGHEVLLIDRQPAAAMETSFANAGEVSAGHASPWAAPGVPIRAIRWMLMRHGPLLISPRADPAMWRFLARMVRQCTRSRYAINKGRMVPLAEYSRDCLRALRGEIGITYDERTLGTLQLFRTQAQLDHSASDIAVLQRFGVAHELLDRDGCIRVEPALARAPSTFVGGLRLPADETGDCHLFTQRLAERAGADGVEYLFDTDIDAINLSGYTFAGVTAGGREHAADACVVALGSYSPAMLAPLGLRVPVYPVKGYSITVPITDPAAAPVSTVMDETYKVAMTRLGDRLRVGGTAEVGGFDLSLRPERRATLEFVTRSLFPAAGDVAQASFWCGLRPMTPDGTPIIGPTCIRNLYVNTGHGTLGWTMACGSGRVIADMVSGKKPEIDATELALARYG
jgi:D-amino-acid dehydrogenase